MMSAPSTVPASVNRPPVSAVPPSVTARMASSSSSWPALLASALLTLELTIRPASPAARPQKVYTQSVSVPARTPATRAASGLPPMARMNRPSAVRDSSSCNASHNDAATHSAAGNPAQ